jgi:hypothetical protein
VGRNICGRATVAWLDHQVRLISYSILRVPIYAGDAGCHVPFASPYLGVPHHLNLKFMQDFPFFFWSSFPRLPLLKANRPAVCLLQINLNPMHTILQAGDGYSDERKGLASLEPLALPQGEYQFCRRERGKEKKGRGGFEN